MISDCILASSVCILTSSDIIYPTRKRHHYHRSWQIRIYIYPPIVITKVCRFFLQKSGAGMHREVFRRAWSNGKKVLLLYDVEIKRRIDGRVCNVQYSNEVCLDPTVVNTACVRMTYSISTHVEVDPSALRRSRI